MNFKTLLVPWCAHRWQFDVARRTADVQNFCTQVVGNKRQISPLSLSFKRMAALSLPRTSTTELKAERVGLACALLCTAAKMAKNWRPCTLSDYSLSTPGLEIFAASTFIKHQLIVICFTANEIVFMFSNICAFWICSALQRHYTATYSEAFIAVICKQRF